MASADSISVSQLSRLIGTPDVPVIVDICIDEDFTKDPRFIPTAFRHPYGDIAALAPQLAGKKVVITCQKGLKLSQGAAAVLRTGGIAAEYLVGGNIAWREAGEVLIPAAAIPARNKLGQTVWVTRHRPKIDRLACPWLIKRFVDPSAQFLFVAPTEVINVAERFHATPFDIDGTFWSHRGENCTFDTMIQEFALKTDAMLRLATIVRGADTDRHDLAPECAGL